MFAELNVSFRVGDDDNAVRENWRRIATAAGAPLRFATMQQVHGVRVATLGPDAVDPGEADALVTREPGVALSVLTADCVPILLVAPRWHVVAAAHAGWRGTIGGIVAHTVAAMAERFGAEPGQIRAVLGPAIGGCCYQVDRAVVDQLEEHWGPMPEAIQRQTPLDTGSDKALLDLRRANACILTRVGIEAAAIVSIGPCTRCASTEFFSYRRASAATGRGITGRQLSFIGWQK